MSTRQELKRRALWLQAAGLAGMCAEEPGVKVKSAAHAPTWTAPALGGPMSREAWLKMWFEKSDRFRAWLRQLKISVKQAEPDTDIRAAVAAGKAAGGYQKVINF